MAQIKLSDIQSSFIIYLHHQGKGRAEAARLADPRQSAFTLTNFAKDHRKNPARAKQSLLKTVWISPRGLIGQ